MSVPPDSCESDPEPAPFDRWEPDANIVAAVLAVPKWDQKLKELSGPDRSWLVAGLTLAGMTAQSIADRTDCSLRLVRTIRAEDMTRVCHLAQEREREQDNEIRQTQLAYRLLQRQLGRVESERDQAKLQLDQIIDAQITGQLEFFPRCSHPKVPYNVYRSNGRDYCRTCRSDWDRDNRKRA